MTTGRQLPPQNLTSFKDHLLDASRRERNNSIYPEHLGLWKPFAKSALSEEKQSSSSCRDRVDLYTTTTMLTSATAIRDANKSLPRRGSRRERNKPTFPKHRGRRKPLAKSVLSPVKISERSRLPQKTRQHTLRCTKHGLVTHSLVSRLRERARERSDATCAQSRELLPTWSLMR